VHRDLKPSNILVGADGKVSILDFGIAKIVEHRPGLTGHGATRTRLPVMTIRYASPEQLQQLMSGRASDIYALGVVLYELLTNQHPFTPEYQQGRAELMAAMAKRQPVSPGNLAGSRRSFPDGIDRMVLKALQFDPGLRQTSVAAFLDELQQCIESV
jgi:serine/threonine protein kinase